MMNLHLAEISATVATGAHAVLTIGGAGWHQTGDTLRVPENITLLRLPPYSPELNPVENVWAYLRSNKLSNCVFDTYEAIVNACCDAWLWLTKQPERITSIETANGRVSLDETGRIIPPHPPIPNPLQAGSGVSFRRQSDAGRMRGVRLRGGVHPAP